MKRAVLIVVGFILFSSHDMFLKLDTYYLDPNVESTIVLLNGTFDLSENSIDRNRMIDVSLVGNGIRTSVDNTQWHDQDNATILTFNSGEAGTWVAGVSTKARNIKLAADDFNNYLEHDGVLDELNWRKENNALETDAVEKYSKHVKTIFQVGDLKTDDWKTVLNYPIEFVPLSNPYDIHPGEEIKFKLLLNGSPLTNQLIYVGSGTSEHSHDHDHEHQGDDHQHTDATQLKTDNNGVITVYFQSFIKVSDCLFC